MTTLDRSLIDRASAIWLERDGPWVNGEPDAESNPGPWFPARLRIEVTAEGDEPVARRALAATLICGPEAEVSGADRVEVESDAYGSAIWDVDGEPLALLRGRRVVGWRARLRRVTS